MARPLLPDGLWAEIAPLLPPERAKPKGGRPRTSDRAALTGILFVLRSGAPWELLPREMGCGSGMTCWRRLRDWQKAGVWDRLQHALLDRLGRQNGIDFSRASLDSASIAAKKGGPATGPNPTDRGKPGTKRHILTDAKGIPLALKLTGANVHDSRMLEAVVDAVPPIRSCWGPPRKRPLKLHADKAYDHRRCRQALTRRRIQPRIARRGIERSQRLGRRRWVVERTLAWFAQFRRLAIRYERRHDIHLAFSTLAAALIVWRFIERWFC
ncbi:MULTISPECIES: IS5 family transposase [Methylobacterium]|uniref:IS5 family transposase n=1 Tax=Methylobacterium currus TaxID=2051553 RepID=A0A2R4WX57_9HYPH|nr:MULTISPECIES: IS5 family transposase [Methylobacterium]MBZ6415607.1 IS5 family transposase [Methylobacterium sp.]AWB26105.1 IS5 family transposase [Methylobacterium currus]MBK3399707.1 IS5 family transposase [Methylobacterium ajmalii]MBK3410825.1 IS5 family transposase [Methylobacterium ajmalii]MBK3422301.1 IS5 family transposase [Methylobacterium ajmalii]